MNTSRKANNWSPEVVYLERISIFNRLYQKHYYNGKSQAFTGNDPINFEN